MEEPLDHLVSVIIPTYNRGHMIDKAISSVLCQSYRKLELIIVDDGSTDHTKTLVESYDDVRVLYHRVEHTGMISRVRNIGMRLAKGVFIAFLDSDDIWMQNKLELQVAALIKHPDCLSISADGHQDDQTADLTYHSFIRKRLFEGIFETSLDMKVPLFPSSWIFYKSIIDTCGGFDESLSVSELEFISRASYEHDAIVFTTPLVTIFRHENSISNIYSEEDNFREKFLLLDKALQAKRLSQTEHRRYTVAHIARLIRSGKTTLHRASQLFAKGWRIRPWSLELYKAMTRRTIDEMKLKET